MFDKIKDSVNFDIGKVWLRSAEKFFFSLYIFKLDDFFSDKILNRLIVNSVKPIRSSSLRF